MKAKPILPFNWRTEFENMNLDYSIGSDLIILDRPVITSAIKYPFKVDVTAAILCLSGTMKGRINLQPYISTGCSLTTILPGQIMEYESISADFSGQFLIMSNRFTESLIPNATARLPWTLSVRDTPVVPIDDEARDGMVSYFEMLKRVIRIKDHPYRMEVARHLTLAFFYGAGASFHSTAERQKTHQDSYVERFLELVQTHYKEQRGLDFYADKLCITAKHLSKVVRQASDKSANDLIDEYVTLEAKALLKSTNMTVEQISEALNFPSQSFFGKYFKRVTGTSPSDYRRKE